MRAAKARETEAKNRNEPLLQDSLAPIPEHLRALSRQFLEAVTKREEDFLSLGQWLQELTAEIRDLWKQSSELSRLVAGEQVQNIMSTLSTDEVQAAVCVNNDFEGKARKDLGSIEDCLNDLEISLSEFRRIARHLKALRMSIRIESARLGEVGRTFRVLADEVGGLAQNIGERSDAMERRRRQLLHSLKSMRLKTLEISDIQKNSFQRMQARLRNNITCLQEVLDRSEENSLALSRGMQKVAERTGDIVTRLQSQDITRQQIEHVSQTLDDAADLLEEKLEQGAENIDQMEAAALVVEVCLLQKEQAGSGRQRLVHGVEWVLRNIEAVAGAVEDMAGGMTGTPGMVEAGGQTLLSKIGLAIAETAGLLEDISERGCTLGKAMHGFAAMVEDVSRQLREIEEIGSEIELMALNASVKAAHANGEGAALGVLAATIQELALLAGTHSYRVSCRLTLMQKASAHMQRMSIQLMDVSAVTAVLNRQKKSVEILDVVSGEFTGRNRAISDLARKMGREFKKEINEVIFHRDFERELTALLQELEKQIRSLQGCLPPGGVMIPSKDLSGMFDRYTMDAERAIHGSKTRESVSRQNRSGLNEEPELGDNVELF